MDFLHSICSHSCKDIKQIITKVDTKNCLTVHVNIWLYLVPSHLRLLVRSQIIFNIWTGNHFAMSYLSFFHIAHSAAEALPLVAGLYGYWHRHFHAVGGVPAQITDKYLKRKLDDKVLWNQSKQPVTPLSSLCMLDILAFTVKDRKTSNVFLCSFFY